MIAQKHLINSESPIGQILFLIFKMSVYPNVQAEMVHSFKNSYLKKLVRLLVHLFYYKQRVSAIKYYLSEFHQFQEIEIFICSWLMFYVLIKKKNLEKLDSLYFSKGQVCFLKVPQNFSTFSTMLNFIWVIYILSLDNQHGNASIYKWPRW